MKHADLLSFEVSPEEDQEIEALMTQLAAKIMPRLRTLEPSERRRRPKMGQKTLSFVERSREQAEIHPMLVPAYFDMAAFKRNCVAKDVLRRWWQFMFPMTVALQDSMQLCGSQAYQGALTIYRSVQAAEHDKATPEAAAVRRDLASRFPRGSSKARQKKGEAAPAGTSPADTPPPPPNGSRT